MIAYIIGLTFIIELASIMGRLVFGPMRLLHKQSPLPIRIHHGYIGLYLIYHGSVFASAGALAIGAALFFSDMLHHAIVLPAWVGSSEFP